MLVLHRPPSTGCCQGARKASPEGILTIAQEPPCSWAIQAARLAFLSPWQQPVEHSLVAPLWTLSIEFYGSMVVLALCWCARRSRALWWSLMLVGMIFTIRSAYICFFIGHMLAYYRRAERPAPVSMLLPVFSIIFGVFLSVSRKYGSRNGCAACAPIRPIFCFRVSTQRCSRRHSAQFLSWSELSIWRPRAGCSPTPGWWPIPNCRFRSI